MKHAGQAALDRLEPLLAQLRRVAGLKERSRGVFYRRSRAFLHFHEDAGGLWADVRAVDGNTFDRIRADHPDGVDTLLARARLSDEPASARRLPDAGEHSGAPAKRGR